MPRGMHFMRRTLGLRGYESMLLWSSGLEGSCTGMPLHRQAVQSVEKRVQQLRARGSGGWQLNPRMSGCTAALSCLAELICLLTIWIGLQGAVIMAAGCSSWPLLPCGPAPASSFLAGPGVVRHLFWCQACRSLLYDAVRCGPYGFMLFERWPFAACPCSCIQCAATT